jgi:ATP-dependent exoDNAse (exonuclease V) beta subunit
MKALPKDQAQRERFANELDKNFSVIAAAGAGKTTAITERIAQIADKPEQACDWFPRLVVVTFTNRAADEMQQRARRRIFEKNVTPNVLAAFNRAFFGTIHSFCMKLLAGHGHHIGLPSRLDLITNDEDLWNAFVQQTQAVGHSLSAKNREALLRHVQLRDLMELGRRGRIPLQFENRKIPCPETIDFSRLRSHQPPRNANRVQALQKSVLDWADRYTNGVDFLPLIECTVEGRFAEKWQETFQEFNEWLSCCALTVAAEMQSEYRRFRTERGIVTFDDQITLALELTRNEIAISNIRQKDYIVILDEAQDTDPQQFEILLEITRPVKSRSRWLDEFKNPPRPGRFCMVGDFQQSIYGDRADLKQYERIHNALVKSESGNEVKFSVTFRLDQSQLDFVNESFRDILNGEGDQIDFIKLNPRPEALPGQVVRLDISAESIDLKALDPAKARVEAEQLAKWLARTDLPNLRARSWEHVAILCPRKKWFAPIADALHDVEIESQIQSETDVQGDSPAHAWFTALLTIMTQPRCAFEIVGVLREIFGLSDHDLALFADGRSECFQIETSSGGTGRVAEVLDLLTSLHAKIADKPLFTAAQRIVSAASLRERLQELFDADLDAELDVLLESAAAAEADGATLEEFAELLRANFATEREARTPRPNAVQLITCQKAKGLEWDAVIVPLFSRRIHTDDDNFPRIVSAPHEQHAFVAFSKADVPAEKKESVKKAQVWEMERLLYVALTRARHTLVLAGDRALFAKANGTAPEASFAKWFRADLGETNEPLVEALNTKPDSCARTSAHQSIQLTADVGAQPAPLPDLSIQQSLTRARDFPHQMLPSTFSPPAAIVETTGADKWKELENEFRATTVPSVATQYGIWWHELVQQIEWLENAALWDALFEVALPSSPDKNRSRKEWETLRKGISKGNDFAARLHDRGSMVHAELPFLWKVDDSRCLEGVIDLAVFGSPNQTCFILDWKTNQIKPDKIDKLRTHYLPQLAAYWKAVSEMTKMEVAAAIYSTAAGELVRYDNDELAREWDRLEKLSASELNSIVDSDRPKVPQVPLPKASKDKPTQLEFPDL